MFIPFQRATETTFESQVKIKGSYQDVPITPNSGADQLPATRQAQQKLSLSIQCLKKTFKQGDAILVECEIKNVGKTEYSFEDRDFHLGRGEVELSTKNSDGKVMSDPAEINPHVIAGTGLSSQTVIPPGSSSKVATFLNLWSLITKPGKYEVTGRIWGYDAAYSTETHFSRLIIASAEPIQIEIEPRNVSLSRKGQT